MIIPWHDIDPETLTNLIEHFVLREGTDYGEMESSMADKIKQVHNQLKSGKAVIVYSDSQASVDIKLRRDLQ